MLAWLIVYRRRFLPSCTLTRKVQRFHFGEEKIKTKERFYFGLYFSLVSKELNVFFYFQIKAYFINCFTLIKIVFDWPPFKCCVLCTLLISLCVLFSFTCILLNTKIIKIIGNTHANVAMVRMQSISTKVIKLIFVVVPTAECTLKKIIFFVHLTNLVRTIIKDLFVNVKECNLLSTKVIKLFFVVVTAECPFFTIIFFVHLTNV